ncbi:hypothetical protein HK097_006833, partial [Rhizophlyctis rosea]
MSFNFNFNFNLPPIFHHKKPPAQSPLSSEDAIRAERQSALADLTTALTKFSRVITKFLSAVDECHDSRAAVKPSLPLSNAIQSLQTAHLEVSRRATTIKQGRSIDLEKLLDAAGALETYISSYPTFKSTIASNIKSYPRYRLYTAGLEHAIEAPLDLVVHVRWFFVRMQRLPPADGADWMLLEKAIGKYRHCCREAYKVIGDSECFEELYEWERTLNIAECCAVDGPSVHIFPSLLKPIPQSNHRLPTICRPGASVKVSRFTLDINTGKAVKMARNSANLAISVFSNAITIVELKDGQRFLLFPPIPIKDVNAISGYKDVPEAVVIGIEDNLHDFSVLCEDMKQGHLLTGIIRDTKDEASGAVKPPAVFSAKDTSATSSQRVAPPASRKSYTKMFTQENVRPDEICLSQDGREPAIWGKPGGTYVAPVLEPQIRSLFDGSAVAWVQRGEVREPLPDLTVSIRQGPDQPWLSFTDQITGRQILSLFITPLTEAAETPDSLCQLKLPPSDGSKTYIFQFSDQSINRRFITAIRAAWDSSSESFTASARRHLPKCQKMRFELRHPPEYICLASTTETSIAGVDGVWRPLGPTDLMMILVTTPGTRPTSFVKLVSAFGQSDHFAYEIGRDDIRLADQSDARIQMNILVNESEVVRVRFKKDLKDEMWLDYLLDGLQYCRTELDYETLKYENSNTIAHAYPYPTLFHPRSFPAKDAWQPIFPFNFPATNLALLAHSAFEKASPAAEAEKPPVTAGGDELETGTSTSAPTALQLLLEAAAQHIEPHQQQSPVDSSDAPAPIALASEGPQLFSSPPTVPSFSFAKPVNVTPYSIPKRLPSKFKPQSSSSDSLTPLLSTFPTTPSHQPTQLPKSPPKRTNPTTTIMPSPQRRHFSKAFSVKKRINETVAECAALRRKNAALVEALVVQVESHAEKMHVLGR